MPCRGVMRAAGQRARAARTEDRIGAYNRKQAAIRAQAKVAAKDDNVVPLTVAAKR
jgi:hypothetical protein